MYTQAIQSLQRRQRPAQRTNSANAMATAMADHVDVDAAGQITQALG